MELNHKNGNRQDDRPSNLEWISHRENIRHSLRVLGARRARGETNGNAKLTEEAVGEIRRLKSDGWSYCQLAARFGVRKGAIWFVVTGRNWKHVTAGLA